jgi:hypothetical protein
MRTIVLLLLSVLGGGAAPEGPAEGMGLGARPSNLLLREAILSLRAECSKNRLCDVARRLRAVFLRSRSRVGLASLATDITRTAP